MNPKYILGQKVKFNFHGVIVEGTILSQFEVQGDSKTMYHVSIPLYDIDKMIMVPQIFEKREEDLERE